MMDGRPGSPGRPAATPEKPVLHALPSTLLAAALLVLPDSVDDKPVYRVKVLTPDGHVKTVVIEAGAR